MIDCKSIDTYVDTLGIRCECCDKDERDGLFNKIITFINKQNIVGIAYDDKNSTKYYQTTKLQHGNSTLASISKGYFKHTGKNGYVFEYYYINISFYGLMRHNKIKDDASRLLVRTIAAHLNTNNIYFRLTEVDIAMDIKYKIKNILAVCTKRTANISYFPLGDKDKDGTTIQKNIGTYYIEEFATHKKKKNAMSRAYLYDKRQKEMERFQRDIGFELTRFELKLQKRFFVKNNYSGSVMDKALQKYTVLYFEDIEQKELLIQQYNRATTSKKRKKVISTVLESNNALMLIPRLNNVYSFLREVDSITYDSQENFKYVKHEDYLYCQSKFNWKY